jgi:hypothetical protein
MKNGKSSKETMSFKELVDLSGAIVRWGALSMGGLCLLMYTNEIGQFPEGLNLGEGLAFYLVCVGFWIVYSLYVMGLTAAGCLLIGPLMKWAQKMNRRRAANKMMKLPRNTDAPTDFSPMWDVLVAVAGVCGLFFIGFYIWKNPKIGWIALLLSLCQGLLVAMGLWLRRQHTYLQSGLVVATDIPSDPDRKLATVRFMQRPLIALLFVLPLLIGPERMFLVDAAFKIAKLRKDNATIHVQKPWSVRVSVSTLQPTESFLGDEYVQFKNVKVLLRSVGEKVVIELPQTGSAPAVKLPVPSSHIIVE